MQSSLSNGDVFFTDPPYGLPTGTEDPSRKRLTTVCIKLPVERPNSSLIPNASEWYCFLPGEKTFLVANSDGDKAIWYAFRYRRNDSISEARIFYDATKESKAGEKGLPDGLRIDRKRNRIRERPGGIWIFDAGGKVLGKIKLTEPASNCALSDDEKTLFITNDMLSSR